jgi:hypothetical protein
MSTNKTDFVKGNYKATVTKTQDGYGDTVFRMVFGYMDKGAEGIDAASLRVYVLKDYITEKLAIRAAKREIEAA